ncbi:ribonuclease HIII [Methanosphaera cuniculi]|uniref:ribonuclease HIII n=1 Tax=Methanosphaera cuniculi TaxID=1077256 RepID=UPI0026F138AD|nr:ribonuclease HIII [Methanosphaera cuniculi]
MKSVKLDDFEVERFMNITRNLHHEKPHQYENIRIKDNGIVFILYNSKKLVYNENPQTIDLLSLIVNKKRTLCNKKQNTSNNSACNIQSYAYTIGSDETGKGEWFGPLVVCAVCTSQSENHKLQQLGVKDSKKLSLNQILNLYHKIEKLGIKHEIIALKPFSYNKLYAKFKEDKKNLNHMLAYLHSKCITNLLKQLNTQDVVVIIDKFDSKKMNEYLKIDPKIKVIQESNGERYTPVATSSIIAKYHYEKILKEIEKRYNINTKKTKIEDIDKNILDKVAKTHFKNVQKYLK